MRFLSCAIGIFCLAVATASATESALPLRVEQLSLEEINAALQRLRAEETLSEIFTPEGQARLLLSGLLETQHGLVWRGDLSSKTLQPIPARFHKFPNALYLRSGSMIRAGSATLSDALAEFRKARTAAPSLPVILDFRAAAPDPEPNLAASLASPFFHRGDLIFALTKVPGHQRPREFRSAGEPLSEPSIIFLLTDREIGGAAEAVAIAIAKRTDAFVIGERTSGRLTRIGQLPIREGFFLEFQQGRFTILGESGELLSAPLDATITPPRPELSKAELFKRADVEGLEALTKEKSRPRFNEAALVAGVNPEIAALEGGGEGDASKEKSQPAADPALKAALDLIEAAQVCSLDPLRPR